MITAPPVLSGNMPVESSFPGAYVIRTPPGYHCAAVIVGRHASTAKTIRSEVECRMGRPPVPNARRGGWLTVQRVVYRESGTQSTKKHPRRFHRGCFFFK